MCRPGRTSIRAWALSYDVFGDGRTALKTSFGRYLSPWAPIWPTRTIRSTRRSTGSGGIGPTRTRTTFPTAIWAISARTGSAGRSATRTSARAIPTPHAMTMPCSEVFTSVTTSGICRRSCNTSLHPACRRELATTATGTDIYSILGGVRWGAGVTDNLLVTPQDFSPFCVTAPVDPRLPNGGGYEVCGIYDVNPEKFGQRENLVRQTADFGDPSRVSDYITFKLDARLDSGFQFGGSMDTGRTVEKQLLRGRCPRTQQLQRSNLRRQHSGQHRDDHRRRTYLPDGQADARKHAGQDVLELPLAG